MHKNFMLVFSWLLFHTGFLSAQVGQQWIARYNGSGNGTDYATALAVDADGNVYVTGYSYGVGTGSDYATVKYDAAGNQLWVARYNGPGNSWDWASALAVDANGNVYVTGWSLGVGTENDYATVKYDAAGNQLWVARYHGPGNSGDGASALAVDAEGNVYVTGGSVGVYRVSDYATVKYDAAGNQLWVARYHGPGYSDEARALAVDANGNVYVTGSDGVDTNFDYATVKYDAAGNQLWVARYNGPGDGTDVARALAVDASGNVYVTGYSDGVGTRYDYATVKYDAAGNQLWVARYNGPGNSWDWASALAVDANGNVYVTGYSWGVGMYYEYATVKYDAAGNQLWVARYNGPGNQYNVATALAVDANGNAYVTGESAGVGTVYDYATVKYDAAGNQLWVARYNGPGNERDAASALAVDANGNVYVTGYSEGVGTGSDYATIKYTQRQTIFLVHGIAQDGGESGDLQNFARNLRERLDRDYPNRFIVDAGFDFWYCANRRECPSDCTIGGTTDTANGARVLGDHINVVNPVGDIILIGYSMGGLIARDMIVNGFSRHRVATLITLGTPNLGYPWLPSVDSQTPWGRCRHLIRQMFGDFRGATPDPDEGQRIFTDSDGQAVTLSEYLATMNLRWTTRPASELPRWVAVAGGICPIEVTEFYRGQWTRNRFPGDLFPLGCTDENPWNDGVVCRQSAAFDLNVGNKPQRQYFANDYSHTGFGSILVFCPGEKPMLYNPPRDGHVMDMIVAEIVGLPE